MQEKEEVLEYQSRGHFPLKQTLKEKSLSFLLTLKLIKLP